MRSAGRFRYPVVVVPDLNPPLVIPFDPLPICGIVPILALGQILLALLAELSSAVFAIADAVTRQAAPTVIAEPFRMRAVDDFPQDAGKVLVIVSAVDAGDILIGFPIRLAG